jgi:hypothetical protein
MGETTRRGSDFFREEKRKPKAVYQRKNEAGFKGVKKTRKKRKKDLAE